MLENTTQVRVRYAETDQMGVVYHANYVVWMEVGRVEAMRAAGVNYAEMEREGVRVAVLGVEVNYKSAARYDDLIDIKTTVVEVQSRMMRIEYAILRASDQQLLATGATRHLFVNLEMKPVRCPEKYYAVFTGACLPRT
ncbi:acyl-CoA thioesterase [Bryobacter aggregatus]|uniref:acyl-CoA thioesterase n=1 Tax=Bryobacter aggregatus TaxID=360054 RepID=UPI00056D268E|nr:thioesterase family protein [Bryobacter aggregatus]